MTTTKNLNNSSSSLTSQATRLKIKIGVSSCLLGYKVRYDGEHQFNPSVKQLSDLDFKLIPFCPEVDIGLGVPRPKIQLVKRGTQIICLDKATYQIDYTQQLIDACNQQKKWLSQVSGYIFKSKSPSCGLSRVKTDDNGSLIPSGEGIFANQVKYLFPDLPIIEEDSLAHEDLARQFIDSVIKYHQITH
ncbi:DUF523 domain-containing protein [Aliikangiella maris]|uniref:DUF523 domain-containing protein n=2 Tax=Aliikangiella maris TaxID=3162458 RepID=A0ABV3MN72_9GAMM